MTVIWDGSQYYQRLFDAQKSAYEEERQLHSIVAELEYHVKDFYIFWRLKQLVFRLDSALQKDHGLTLGA